MTQTGKLKRLLSEVSTEVGTPTGNQKFFLSPYEIAQILKACKEAGVVFETGEMSAGYHQLTEEIEIG